MYLLHANIGTPLNKEFRQLHVPVCASQKQRTATIQIPSMHIRPAIHRLAS